MKERKKESLTHVLALGSAKRRIALPSEHAFSESYLSISMAAHIVSWGRNEKIVSPRLSKTPSMISFNSILLSDNPETPPVDEGDPCATGSQVKHTNSQVIEPSGTKACPSASVYPGADAAEGPFIRHHKYFFKDGNVTFLVRSIQP